MALSRARHGLFVFGNAAIVRNASKSINENHMWIQILKLLHNSDQIVEGITLKCLNHENKTIVKLPEDFKNTPEGGCHLPCKIRMSCGHACERTCHLYKATEEDPTGHEEVKCIKPCVRERECMQASLFLHLPPVQEWSLTLQSKI